MDTMPISMQEQFQAIIKQIFAMPQVRRVFLYGSYAKGLATTESDVDLAVFFAMEKESFLDEYRALVKICNNPYVDYQVQAFSVNELDDPCGIIQEIVQYGLELRPAAE